MTRPLVGICAAVHAARFGPWDQDVALVPTAMTTAVRELGWLAVLLTIDEALADDPDDALSLLDGLIVPDPEAYGDRYADFSRRLGEAAEARGVPVVKLDAALLVPGSTAADYRGAIAGLFTGKPRASSAS
jgi:gamma-glutamyl-gamma-aminobutyrate hydrolase PuuD